MPRTKKPTEKEQSIEMLRSLMIGALKSIVTDLEWEFTSNFKMEPAVHTLTVKMKYQTEPGTPKLRSTSTNPFMSDSCFSSLQELQNAYALEPRLKDVMGKKKRAKRKSKADKTAESFVKAFESSEPQSPP